MLMSGKEEEVEMIWLYFLDDKEKCFWCILLVVEE